MFCTKCGRVVDNNAKFCINCGNNLVNIENVNNLESTKKNGLATASMIIGIISLIFSFILNIFIFPLAIIGLILGIVNKNKCGQKIAGIVLNIVSMIISIIVLITFIFIIFIFEHHWEENFAPTPVSGSWNCKSFGGSGVGDNYIVSLYLDNSNYFSWNKYNDEYNNHVYGYYTYTDLEKTNNSGEYKYYNLKLDGYEFVSDGELQDEDYVAEYEIGINDEQGEAILMNIYTYNMYYCYLEY